MDIKQINLNKVADHSKDIAEMVGESEVVSKVLDKMMHTLREFDGDGVLTNGELMALAASLVARIVHRTLEADPECPLTDEEMRVAVGFAALQLKVVTLN